VDQNIDGVQGDVSILSDLDRLAAHIKTKYGKVDIIFANAGLGNVTPFDQVSEAEFDHIFGVNAKGLFFTVQKLLPLVPDGGSIILNASSVPVWVWGALASTLRRKLPCALSPAHGPTS
jgi:NAD(P)-dependent dehydrogenase (short-subunit alcohol dehydrogenase family)